MLGVYRGELDGVDLDDLAAAARAVVADGEPRSMPEIGRALGERPGTGRLVSPVTGQDGLTPGRREDQSTIGGAVLAASASAAAAPAYGL
ncbi:hypothetical protein ACGFH8_00510 [Micromonospora sp. NPDC049175]|uniref:hypothetical protein n=1 Tax=Micromonospora sp. NPDC049175 TaxID=3364266 RepID=UPI0037207D38